MATGQLLRSSKKAIFKSYVLFINCLIIIITGILVFINTVQNSLSFLRYYTVCDKIIGL